MGTTPLTWQLTTKRKREFDVFEIVSKDEKYHKLDSFVYNLDEKLKVSLV